MPILLADTVTDTKFQSHTRLISQIFFLWKSATFHPIKLPIDAKVAEKFLNGI